MNVSGKITSFPVSTHTVHASLKGSVTFARQHGIQCPTSLPKERQVNAIERKKNCRVFDDVT